MREPEAAIKERVETLLRDWEPRLAIAGVRCSEPEVDVSAGDQIDYTSELRIWVFRGGHLVDVIEYLIFLNGRPQVDVDEMTQWIEAELRRLVASAKEGS